MNTPTLLFALLAGQWLTLSFLFLSHRRLKKDSKELLSRKIHYKL